MQNKFIRHYSKKYYAHEAPIFKYKRLGGGGEEVVVVQKLKASGEMAKTNKFMMHTDKRINAFKFR